MDRVFHYVCKICGLKVDATECDHDYEPEQIYIRFYCPIFKDGTKMTPDATNIEILNNRQA